MACGTPVTISDRQAMTEAAGDAALRFEAPSAEALVNVLAATLLASASSRPRVHVTAHRRAHPRRV